MKIIYFVFVLALLASACSGSPSTPLPPPTQIASSSGPTGLPTILPTVTPAPTAALPPGWPVASLKIVSSLPLTGNSQDSGLAISNAMQLRLLQGSNQACGGKYALTYEPWDDASAALGQWDPAVETQNAKNAAADKSIIAYLGPFNSGAAKMSIPILNRSGPLVMISPSNTYPGLTKPGTGSPDEPNKYYPTGVRNYTRVVGADDGQGKTDSNFLFDKLGVKTVYVIDDQGLYGRGIANIFVTTAKSLGIKVIGRSSINQKAADYKALMTVISTSNNGVAPDAIFVGMDMGGNVAQVLIDKVAVMGSNTKVKFMGPDGIQTQALIDNTGGSVADGVYASVNGLPFPDGLTDLGKQFVADYEAKYGQLTEPYAVYGYESMNVLLKAIEDICIAGGDPFVRKQVRDAVFAIKDFTGALGTWSFDKNGDTTLTNVTIYQVKGGSFQVVGSFK